jgi:hypothetical protein
VGGVRGQSTQNDVIRKTVLEDLDSFMRGEAIADQYPRFLVRSCFSLGGQIYA